MSTCTNNDIVKLLIESEALSEGDQVLFDVPLNEMGVTSLDKFNLFLLIEERFGIQVPDDDFTVLQTINEIVAYISKRQTETQP